MRPRCSPSARMRCALCLLGVFAAAMGAVGPSGAQTPLPSVDTLAVLLRGSLRDALLTSGAASAGSVDTLRAAEIPEAAQAELDLLNVRDADLRDVFRGIAHEYDLNLVVDNRIDRRVTVRLSHLSVHEALVFLCEQQGLDLRRTGAIYHVILPPALPEPPPPPPRIFVRDSLLSVDLRGDDLERVVRLVAQQSGLNILVRRGVQGTLTGALQGVPLDQGLRTLAAINGFIIRHVDGIYQVDRRGSGSDANGDIGAFWVQVEDSLIALDVVEAPIRAVLRELAAQLDVSLITYDVPEGHITARAHGLRLGEALRLLLRQTPVTFRRENGVYVIGDKHTSGLAETRLIRLSHMRAETVLDLIPDDLRNRATLQVVREHNGLMVTGANDVTADLEQFVRAVDYPTPQILIQALVVDFEANDLFELGLDFGRDAATAAAEAATGYRFGGALQGGGDAGLHLGGDGRQVGAAVDDLSRPLRNLFGIGKIGRLPDDFFVRIRALSVEGRATIRSRPQVATLNGHPASLVIGTTQYYILRSQTPYQNPNQVLLSNTQRFEKIEANVKLDITPWVSASGEITAEIRPEFSAPVGEFDPDVPPTINTRVLESTVRLRDGETIILGGLIQDEEEVTYHRVPLLGRLPLVGRFFRSTAREKVRRELVIFLTPHVFYGEGQDLDRWERLREELDLDGLDERGALRRLIDLRP